MLGEYAEWGAHEENTAWLLEVQAYQLELDWIRATTDPNDPKVRRERLEAERKGIRPPARPIVPPRAMRPPGLAEERLNAYIEALTRHGEAASSKELVSLAEFDRVIALG